MHVFKYGYNIFTENCICVWVCVVGGDVGMGVSVGVHVCIYRCLLLTVVAVYGRAHFCNSVSDVFHLPMTFLNDYIIVLFLFYTYIIIQLFFHITIN